jgi:hypothetical protein
MNSRTLFAVVTTAVILAASANMAGATGETTGSKQPDLAQQRDILLKEHEAWRQARDQWQRDLENRKAERDERRQQLDPDTHVKEMQKAAERVIERGVTKGIPAAFGGKTSKAGKEGAKMLKDVDKELTEADLAVEGTEALRTDQTLKALNRDVVRLQKDVVIANQKIAENEQQITQNTQAMKAAFNDWTGKVLGQLAQAQRARDTRKQAEAEKSRPAQTSPSQTGGSPPTGGPGGGGSTPNGRTTEPREPRDRPDPHVREPREPKGPPEARVREPKEPKEPKQPREPKEPKGPKGNGPGVGRLP